MKESNEMSSLLNESKGPNTRAGTAAGIHDSNGESDPMVKDKKILELSGLEVIPLFLLNVLVALPIWIAILLPLTLIYQGVLLLLTTISKAVGLKKKSRKNAVNTASVTASANVTTRSGEREHDLIVFGATGFTGQMAAVYIAKRYGSKFKWAIAGRRMSALQELKSKLCAIDPTLRDLPIVIADTGDITSLEAMVKRTKVIISTTGAKVILLKVTLR